MKFSFSLFALVLDPVAMAAPRVAPSEVIERQKAIVFLDGIAAKHRKLRSLSGTWKQTSREPRSGSLAWLHSKPAKVRYEDNGPSIQTVFVSNGVRKHEIAKGDFGESQESIWSSPVPLPQGDVFRISCDEVTFVVLSGVNPLRLARWSPTKGTPNGARLLPASLVRGVRCRGVEWKEFLQTPDILISVRFSMWFDKRGLVRRTRETTVGNQNGVKTTVNSVVDFDLRPNIKLSPALFQIPNRPDDITASTWDDKKHTAPKMAPPLKTP